MNLNNDYPAVPANLVLSDHNCEQRINSYFNYLKKLHKNDVPLRN